MGKYYLGTGNGSNQYNFQVVDSTGVINDLNLSGLYLSITGKAADADKLDNYDSSFFRNIGNLTGVYTGAVSGKASDSELLDGLDSSYFLNGANITGTVALSGTFTGYYTGAFSGTITHTDSITFHTGLGINPDPAELTWSDDVGTMQLGLQGGNVDLRVGLQNYEYVTNRTASTISKGSVIYVSGAQGNRPSISLALGAADTTSANTFGLAAENIASMADGYAITNGLLTNLNTTGFAEGAALYLSPTVSGAITSTKPQAPQHSVLVGFCVRSHASAGEILVKIQNGLELDELHDVRILNKQNNDIIRYNAPSGIWYNSDTLAINGTGANYISGNLGIGTYDPSAKLHILGADKRQIIASTTDNAALVLGQWDGTTNRIESSTRKLLLTSYASGISLGINGSENVHVSTSGNLGVGTTNPSQKLDVNGASVFRDTINVGPNIGVISWGSMGGGTGFGIRAESGRGFSLGSNGNWDYVVIDTSGNVGVGATTPTAKLNVHKPFTQSGLYEAKTFSITTDNGTSSWTLGQIIGYVCAGASNSASGFPGGLMFKTKAADSNAGESGVATRMVINAAGNVGIGTTDPAELLDIAASANNGATAGPKINFKKGSTNKAVIGIGGNYLGQATNTDDLIFRNDAGSILFGFNGSEKMRINTDGQLMINTGAISTFSKLNLGNGGIDLQVDATTTTSTKMNANATNNVLAIRAPFNATPAATGNANAKWGIWFSGGPSYDTVNYPYTSTEATTTALPKSAAIYAVSEDSANGYNRQVGLAFYTSNFDANMGERVRIDRAGNVGIATTSPSYKLHVNGNSFFEDILNIAVDKRIQTYPTSIGGYAMGLTLWSANTSGASEAYGRPGFIGRNLSWNGSNFIAASSNGASNWGVVTGMMVTNTDVRFLTRAASENGLDYSLGTDLTSITRMVINTSGNVGIGFTTPESKLHIAGTHADESADRAAATVLTLDTKTNGSGDGKTYFKTGWVNTGNYGVSTIGVGYYSGSRQVRDVITMLGNGNVGIGATSPKTILDVYNNSDIWHFMVGGGTSKLLVGGQAAGGVVLQGGAASTANNAAVTSAYNILLQRDGGNVGIGNAAASYKLHIGDNSATASAHMMLDGVFGNTTVASHARIYFNDTNFGIGAGGWASSGSDDDLYLWTYDGTGRDIRFAKTSDGTSAVNTANWTTNMIIKNDGSVGIGTITPSYNLEVAKASAGATFAVNADMSAAGEASIIAFTSRQYNTYYKAAIIAYDPHGGSWNRRGLAFCVNNTTDGTSATYASDKALYIAPDKNSTFYGDVTVAGNFTVNGTTTTVNTTTLDVKDLNITVAKGAANAAAANGAGLTIDGASATLLYQSTGDKFVFNKALDISGDTISINGGKITNRQLVVPANSTRYLKVDITNSFGNVFVRVSGYGSAGSASCLISWMDAGHGGGTAYHRVQQIARIAQANPVLGSLKKIGTGAYISIQNTNAAEQITLHVSTDAYGSQSVDCTATLETTEPAGGIDLSILNIDEANSRVGVGTTTPNASLQIAGTGTGILTVGTLTNDWGGVVAIGTTNGNGIILSKVNAANDSNRVLTLMRSDADGASITGYKSGGTSADIGFQIRANAKSYFNGGNVGIGTTDPSYKLHVAQTGNVAGLYVATDNVTTASVVGGSIHVRDTTASSSPATAGKAGIAFSSNPGTDYVIGKYWTGSESRFFLSDGSATSEYLTVKSSGNVGIGTTAPDEKLTVRGSLGIGTGANTQAALTIVSVNSSSANHNHTFSGQSTGTNDSVTWDLNRGGGAYGGFELKFNAVSRFYIGAGGSFVQDSYVIPARNFGIGETAPSEKLHVVGNVRIVDSLLNFKIQRVPIEGNPQGGTYKGYILLAKAYTSGLVNESYVIGKIVMRRGTATSGHNLDVYEVVSTKGYAGETFSVNHVGAGSDSFQLQRLVKCTYGGVVYHAIESSVGGGAPSTEMTFEGCIVDSPLKMTDGSYVSSVVDYGNIGISTISSSGNIGIGTKSPSGRLHVTGSTGGSSAYQILANGDITTGAYQYGISSDGTLSGTSQSNVLYVGGTVKASTTIAEWAGIRVDAPAKLSGAAITTLKSIYANASGATNNYAIYTDNGNIYFGGNVGIGATAPGQKLDVVGAILAREATTQTYGAILKSVNSQGSAFVGWSSDNHHGIWFRSSVSADGTTTTGADVMTFREYGEFQFWTGAGTMTKKLNIAQAGKIAITPSNYSAASWTTTGALTEFGSATVTNNNTAASGTAASAVFHSFATPTLAATNTSVTTTAAATIYIAGDVVAGTNQTITNSYGLWNAGKTRLDGNVGIGSASPTAKLEVESGASDTAGIRVRDSGNGVWTEIRRRSIECVGGDFWINSQSSFLDLRTANSSRLYISATGDVGIGTIGPDYKFHVKTGAAAAIIKFEAATGQYLYGGVDTGFYFEQVGTSAANRLFRLQSSNGSGTYTQLHIDGGNQRIYTSSNANIGIGITNPSSKLEVAIANDTTTGEPSAWDNKFAVFGTGGSSTAGGVFISYDQTNNRGYIGALSPSSAWRNLILQPNAGSGNVGIGTKTPGYKLEVNGSFAATTKSFVISHPTKEGKKLRYGSLEGPENGVYIRGKTTSKVIELPDYWIKLVDPESISVQLTPIGSHQKLYVEKIEDNKVYIANENLLAKSINCFFYILAERADVEKLQVEIDA